MGGALSVLLLSPRSSLSPLFFEFDAPLVHLLFFPFFH
jgi:hypothetical protein